LFEATRAKHVTEQLQIITEAFTIQAQLIHSADNYLKLCVVLRLIESPEFNIS